VSVFRTVRSMSRAVERGRLKRLPCPSDDLDVQHLHSSCMRRTVSSYASRALVSSCTFRSVHDKPDDRLRPRVAGSASAFPGAARLDAEEHHDEDPARTCARACTRGVLVKNVQRKKQGLQVSGHEMTRTRCP
jgi:hypothetical protein